MKILLISSDFTTDDYFYNAFDSIAEDEELQVCRTIAEADCFIAGELILKQKRLDIIITDLFENEGRSARDFCYDLRNDTKNTYSQGNFKLSSIPIILMFPGRLNRQQYLNFGFDEIIDSTYDNFYGKLLRASKDIVKKWRNLVYDGLELLKVGEQQVFNKADYILQRSKSEITKILSDEYVRRKSKLELPWFQRDHCRLEEGLELLVKRIKEAEKSVKKEEKKFHQVMNAYQELLLRGSYCHYCYEPQFPKTLNHYAAIPDFILRRYYSDQEIEVLEFKTPNEKFYKRMNFHPMVRQAIFNHVGQVKDYKDYLEDPENQERLQSELGLKPLKVHYNRVIGRREDFIANQSLYERRARHFNLDEVDIVTFDDLVDCGERYYDEMVELSV